MGLRPGFSAQVRFGEPGAPVLIRMALFAGKSWTRTFEVSHISRKTSEIWGTRRVVTDLEGTTDGVSDIWGVVAGSEG
jgi:hypothetical protein